MIYLQYKMCLLKITNLVDHQEIVHQNGFHRANNFFMHQNANKELGDLQAFFVKLFRTRNFSMKLLFLIVFFPFIYQIVYFKFLKKASSSHSGPLFS